MPSPVTIDSAIREYLESLALARSPNTARTYHNALNLFIQVLELHHLPTENTPASAITEQPVSWMIQALKYSSASTERLYLTALTGLYEYLVAENLAEINLPKVRMLIKQRARKPGIRLPIFPKSDIDDVIHCITEAPLPEGAPLQVRLRLLRDRAFLMTLADTGLRVHEACNLCRGDLDYNEGKAVVIGKGNREAIVRFSERSTKAIKTYIKTRATLDGISGKNLASLPLFARHDRGAGKKVKPMSPQTGRLIVAEWVEKAIGPEAVGTITPHSFRHYFVTRVLQGSGNLKLAQELARHRSIAVTQRYAHLSDDELDRGYRSTIEEKDRE